MKKDTLNATNLRIVLLGLTVVSLCGVLAGMWFLQGILSTQMSKTNDVKIASARSSDDLAKAQSLKLYLQTHQQSIQKTARVVADTAYYQYQNQIVNDITAYAKTAEVTILGFDFPTASAGNGVSATGLRSIAANITLRNPLPYQNYLKFLKLIEQNLTKMQVTNISVTPDPANPTLVSNTVVGIEVFTK